MNAAVAASMLLLVRPTSEFGVTRYGPMAGAEAVFVTADAHKGWTFTRIVGGVATAGATSALFGRKNKGLAAINIAFTNGEAASFDVKPDRLALAAANRYVTAFNVLAIQLAAEPAE